MIAISLVQFETHLRSELIIALKLQLPVLGIFAEYSPFTIFFSIKSVKLFGIGIFKLIK